MEDISIWLLPSAKNMQEITEVIEKLAHKYRSEKFLPHLTAYYLASEVDLNDAVKTVKKIAQKAKPFWLELERVSYDTVFTKTLFAKYYLSPEFESLYNLFKNEFYSRCPYDLSPHMSLIYKHGMAVEGKQTELKNLTVPNKLHLDSIAIITKPGTGIKTERDVLEWKISYISQLGQ